MTSQSRPIAPARRTRALLACALLPATIALIELERALLTNGWLNKRDLGPIGGERGTLGEYVTNVWMWDGALFALTLLALPLFAWGAWTLLRGRRAR